MQIARWIGAECAYRIYGPGQTYQGRVWRAGRLWYAGKRDSGILGPFATKALAIASLETR